MEQTDTPHTPRSLRARLDISQVELATRAGVSERTIKSLENGEDVSLDSLRSISAALGVTTEILIGAIDAERARRAPAVPRTRPHRGARRSKGAA